MKITIQGSPKEISALERELENGKESVKKILLKQVNALAIYNGEPEQVRKNTETILSVYLNMKERDKKLF